MSKQFLRPVKKFECCSKYFSLQKVNFDVIESIQISCYDEIPLSFNYTMTYSVTFHSSSHAQQVIFYLTNATTRNATQL